MASDTLNSGEIWSCFRAGVACFPPLRIAQFTIEQRQESDLWTWSRDVSCHETGFLFRNPRKPALGRGGWVPVARFFFFFLSYCEVSERRDLSGITSFGYHLYFIDEYDPFETIYLFYVLFPIATLILRLRDCDHDGIKGGESILGFHVTSKKKIKLKSKQNFQFLSLSRKIHFKNIAACMFSSR